MVPRGIQTIVRRVSRQASFVPLCMEVLRLAGAPSPTTWLRCAPTTAAATTATAAATTTTSLRRSASNNNMVSPRQRSATTRGK